MRKLSVMVAALFALASVPAFAAEPAAGTDKPGAMEGGMSDTKAEKKSPKKKKMKKHHKADKADAGM